jgi:hypothetical protein
MNICLIINLNQGHYKHIRSEGLEKWWRMILSCAQPKINFYEHHPPKGVRCRYKIQLGKLNMGVSTSHFDLKRFTLERFFWGEINAS